MIKKLLASLTLSTSVVILVSMFAPVVHAQSKTYDYNFCTDDDTSLDQNLVDSIASVLNYNYQGGVKTVTPLCHGPNPNQKNKTNWVYRADFKDGSSLDVAVMEGSDDLLISIQDKDRVSANGAGWTKWIPLRSR